MNLDGNKGYDSSKNKSTFKHSVPVFLTLFIMVAGFGLLGFGVYALFQLRPDFETQRQNHEKFLERKKTAAATLADKYSIKDSREIIETRPTINSYADFQNYVKNITAKKGGYSHQLFDIIGTDVKTPAGVAVGAIEDILLHRQSGQPRAIIENESGVSYIKNLGLLSLDQIITDSLEDKQVLMLNEDQFNVENEIYDKDSKQQDWISLRRLREGQVLDFQGGFISKSRTTIYGNADVQGIYFNLCPLTKKNKTTPLRIPLKGLRFIENDNGINIALTEEQTFALAKWCS